MNIEKRYREGSSKSLLSVEQAVLGAVILDKSAISTVAHILNDESFFDEKNKKVWQGCISLFNNSAPIDLLTLAEELKSRGDLEIVGGAAYLAELTIRVASSANLEYHARILSQFEIRRTVSDWGHSMINNAADDEKDPLELLEYADKTLHDITRRIVTGNDVTAAKSVSEHASRIELIMKGEMQIGLATLITEFDEVTKGYKSPDLVVLAARPGMGKTAKMLTDVRNLAVLGGIPCGIFSLEMSHLQLIGRLISQESNLSSTQMESPTNWSEFQTDSYRRATERVGSAPIYIDDTPAISILHVRSKARRWVTEFGVKAIFIDYMQLMKGEPSAGNREQEISSISRGLKAMAKELDVPVIALSQLNRSVESRGGSKRPMLSDLRESGSIEQDADIVYFLYRPEYYGIMEDAEGRSTKGFAEMIIAKNRNGPLISVRSQFDGRISLFTNRDSEDYFTYDPQPSIKKDNSDSYPF